MAKKLILFALGIIMILSAVGLVFAYTPSYDVLTREIANFLYAQLSGYTMEGDINMSGHFIINEPHVIDVSSCFDSPCLINTSRTDDEYTIDAYSGEQYMRVSGP